MVREEETKRTSVKHGFIHRRYLMRQRINCASAPRDEGIEEKCQGVNGAEIIVLVCPKGRLPQRSHGHEHEALVGGQRNVAQFLEWRIREGLVGAPSKGVRAGTRFLLGASRILGREPTGRATVAN